MKILTLLRHAKATWDDPVARDFDRPLNRRGHKAARRIGREMRALGLAFDRVLASPAARVKETLREVEQGYGAALDPAFEPHIYLAEPEALIALIRATPDEVASLLLVGHNPGLERLALLLSAASGDACRTEIALKYPTGALAEIGLAVESWRDIAPGIGRIARFLRPRDLDPELGPDEDSL